MKAGGFARPTLSLQDGREEGNEWTYLVGEVHLLTSPSGSTAVYSLAVYWQSALPVPQKNWKACMSEQKVTGWGKWGKTNYNNEMQGQDPLRGY